MMRDAFYKLSKKIQFKADTLMQGYGKLEAQWPRTSRLKSTNMTGPTVQPYPCQE